jgi:hypothetical protein
VQRSGGKRCCGWYAGRNRSHFSGRQVGTQRPVYLATEPDSRPWGARRFPGPAGPGAAGRSRGAKRRPPMLARRNGRGGSPSIFENPTARGPFGGGLICEWVVSRNNANHFSGPLLHRCDMGGSAQKKSRRPRRLARANLRSLVSVMPASSDRRDRRP